MESQGLTGFRKRLVDEQLVSSTLVESAWLKARKSKCSFIEYLVEQESVDPKRIASVVSGFFSIPMLDLGSYDQECVPDISRYWKFVENEKNMFPLFERGGKLFVAVFDPNIHALDEIKFHSGMNVVPIIVQCDHLRVFIDKVMSQDSVDNILGDFSESLDDIGLALEESHDDDDQGQDENFEDPPIVRFVHKALLDGISTGASDIHFEPYENVFRIRYRQDGVLNEVARLPIVLANRITARLKVLSRLDVSERRVPQDGRFKIALSYTSAIDFRVSTCPVMHGEKVVIRVLDPASIDVGIEKLGFSEAQEEIFLDAVHRAQGMVLVTGPTGSGKTVSLYSALQILNTMERNISTIEDPVEIKIPGINQVQIHTRAGLTFSSALRSFLRQDPDVIMVGEMRDLETTEIAIKAAQTGHMVLSTLHTNSAIESLRRMIDMGVSPFNIASAVTLIIAQRLLRKLCTHCKKQSDMPHDALLKEGFTPKDVEGLVLYEPVGCDKCMQGYKGRVGIYEALAMTHKISDALLSGMSSNDLLQVALSEGMLTLRQSGIEKIKLGITTLNEVNRVTIV